MKTKLAALLVVLAIPSAAAEPVKPLPAGDAAPMMVIDTATFLKVATGANQFEIESSKVALDQGGAELKPLAEMIIADHTKAGETLRMTLEGNGLAFSPAPLAPKQAKMMEQLRAASGPDFDALYLDVQGQAHMEAVALFRTYAGSGDDQSVVAFAKATLPRLEAHLHHVTRLVDAE